MMSRLALWGSAAALLAIACASATNVGTQGGGDAGASDARRDAVVSPPSDGATVSTPDAEAGAPLTAIEKYCGSPCTSATGCPTSEIWKCRVALMSEPALDKYAACSSCELDACGANTTGWATFDTACKTKVGSCGAELDGFTSADCSTFFPLFRPDARAEFEACLGGDCASLFACWIAAAKKAEPEACAGI